MKKIWYKLLLVWYKAKRKREERKRLREAQKQIRDEVLRAIAQNSTNIYISSNEKGINIALDICKAVGVKVRVRDNEYKVIVRDE
jgi:ABC-type branched-subunit amino acid transport system substrate-binding protein